MVMEKIKIKKEGTIENMTFIEKLERVCFVDTCWECSRLRAGEDQYSSLVVRQRE